MPLAPVLYRQLLHAARRHDVQPALKSLLIHPTQEAIKAPTLHEWAKFAAPTIRQLADRVVEKGEGEGKSDSSGDSSSTSSSFSISDVLPLSIRAFTEQRWRRSASPLVQRTFDTIFHGKGSHHYWPQEKPIDFRQLASKEFRRAIQEAKSATAKKKSTAESASIAASSTSATPASSSSPTASPSASTYLTDGFSLLRALNKNLAANSGLKMHPAEMEVDPALEWWTAMSTQQVMNPTTSDTASPPKPLDPRCISPSLLSDLRLRLYGLDLVEQARAEGREEAVPQSFRELENSPEIKAVRAAREAWSKQPLMRSATSLAAGRFLVAHPQMDSPWRHAVILLLRHDEHGSVGVIVNRPASFSLDFSPRSAQGDHVLPLVPARLGGPVKHMLPDARISQLFLAGRGAEPSAIVLLHRIPALAQDSQEVLGGEYPIWSINSKESFIAAVSRLVRLSDAHSALSSPSPPPFLSSDLLTFHGLCTWTHGQLQLEIAEGSWKVAEGSAWQVFGQETEGEDEQAPNKNVVKLGTSISEDLPESVLSASVSTSAPAPAPTPNRSAIPFPLDHLWAHAMHRFGGKEHGAMARIPIDYEPTHHAATTGETAK